MVEWEGKRGGRGEVGGLAVAEVEIVQGEEGGSAGMLVLPLDWVID